MTIAFSFTIMSIKIVGVYNNKIVINAMSKNVFSFTFKITFKFTFKNLLLNF